MRVARTSKYSRGQAMMQKQFANSAFLKAESSRRAKLFQRVGNDIKASAFLRVTVKAYEPGALFLTTHAIENKLCSDTNCTFRQ